MNLIKMMSDKTKLDKKIVIIALVGIMGIALLIISEILPSQEPEALESEPTQDTSYTEYAQNIEEKLQNIISSIQGAGKTQVMVTLDCSDENVYATQSKRVDGENSSSYENSIIIVENDGEENGVLLKVIEPEIRGVAIVCDGGNSPQVKQSIIDTVTAVLGISSARVNIATMKTDNGG